MKPNLRPIATANDITATKRRKNEEIEERGGGDGGGRGGGAEGGTRPSRNDVAGDGRNEKGQSME